MKKLAAFLLAGVMALSMTACTGTTEQDPATATQSSQTEPASDKAILMVSFGTSYNETRELTIDAIEADVAEAYSDWEVRRAFTADTVIDILAERDGLEIDNMTEAMDRLVADGIKEVVVQPTHVMNGAEYDDIVEEVNKYIGKFDSLRMGQPLLSSIDDYTAVINSLMGSIAEAGADDTAIVFMGHGTHHYANASYSQMEMMLHSSGYENTFVGTVEGYPTLDDVMAKVKAANVSKVILYPLMVVAGDHATNDMAGDEEDSWKTAFEQAGYEVECRLEGLGQNENIREIYLQHIANAMAAEPLAAAEPADVAGGTCDPDKKAILTVSFGTSYNETRELTIDALEAKIADAYPDWDVCRAFTAQTVIDILAERDNLDIDNVKEAMERLIAEGYGTVVIQPTHVMPGAEYDDVVEEVNQYADQFASLAISQPMLMETLDYEAAVMSIAQAVPEVGAEDTAIVLMGHGTHHFANACYSQLQETFWDQGYEHIFVGTVEGYPSYDDVLAQLNASGIKNVVMYPFMIVAGDHATNDMAGDEEDSWKTMLEEAGYSVECRLEGLGQNEGIVELILSHLKNTIENM